MTKPDVSDEQVIKAIEQLIEACGGKKDTFEAELITQPIPAGILRRRQTDPIEVFGAGDLGRVVVVVHKPLMHLAAASNWPLARFNSASNHRA